MAPKKAPAVEAPAAPEAPVIQQVDHAKANVAAVEAQPQVAEGGSLEAPVQPLAEKDLALPTAEAAASGPVDKKPPSKKIAVTDFVCELPKPQKVHGYYPTSAGEFFQYQTMVFLGQIAQSLADIRDHLVESGMVATTVELQEPLDPEKVGAALAAALAKSQAGE